MKQEIIITADGSRTIHVPELDEHYHSIYGARTESEHIFIRHALQRRLEDGLRGQLQLLEVGFGTGLNALLTLLHQLNSPTPYSIKYITYELYPLEEKSINQLFSDSLSSEEWEWMIQLHSAPWDREVMINPQFILHKVKEDLTSCDLPKGNDIIFMDAFAPEKTPSLWTPAFLKSLYESANQGAWLSTYCAKGIIRRTLQEVGFEVYRVAGPPHGKREILTAHKR